MAPTRSGEVEELKQLFASPPRGQSPPRESALPLTRIAKFGIADENSRLAAQGRLEKEERMRRREEEQMERLAKAHENRMKIADTRARAKLHQELTKEKNQNLVRSIRATEAEWQVEREQAYQDMRDEGRQRVLIANALDARLDAQEEAVDAEERKEGTQARQEVMRQVENVRQKKLEENRQMAYMLKQETTVGVNEANAKAALAKKRAGDAKREESKLWKEEKHGHVVNQMVRADLAKAAVRASSRQAVGGWRGSAWWETYRARSHASWLCSPCFPPSSYPLSHLIDVAHGIHLCRRGRHGTTRRKTWTRCLGRGKPS